MKTIADSDFLISFRFDNQSTHLKAKQIYQSIKTNKTSQIFILNLCLQESATVISKKYSQMEAVRFVKDINLLSAKHRIQIIDINQEIETKAWQVFLRQTRENISFVDCAILATFTYYKLDKILSFDKFYPKSTLVKPKT